MSIRPFAAAAAVIALVTTATFSTASTASAAAPDESVAHVTPAVAAAKVTTTGADSGTTTDISPMHWSCGRAAPPDLDTSGGHHTLVVANVRVGSSTRCAVRGTISPSESLDYHCYALDINQVDTWTYVVSVQTRLAGWIRDDLLNDYGSYVWCPGQTNLP